MKHVNLWKWTSGSVSGTVLKPHYDITQTILSNVLNTKDRNAVFRYIGYSFWASLPHSRFWCRHATLLLLVGRNVAWRHLKRLCSRLLLGRHGTKAIPDKASVHTLERWFRRDFCNGKKLCCTNIWSGESYIAIILERFSCPHESYPV